VVKVWREEDHPRGYHGHFISKVANAGSLIVDAAKAAGGVVAERAKQLGQALFGQATVVPAALGVFYSTLFARTYRRPQDFGAQLRSDYGKLHAVLADESNFPSWMLPVSVETWNHILDGHAPESTDDPDADKFVDGSTDAIVALILSVISLSEPNLRYGSQQPFFSSYNGQVIRIYLEYIDGIGKWELTSVHPFSGDIVNNRGSGR